MAGNGKPPRASPKKKKPAPAAHPHYLQLAEAAMAAQVSHFDGSPVLVGKLFARRRYGLDMRDTSRMATWPSQWKLRGHRYVPCGSRRVDLADVQHVAAMKFRTLDAMAVALQRRRQRDDAAARRRAEKRGL